MHLWLDTINPKVIQRAKELNLIYGITTNPSLLSRASCDQKIMDQLLSLQEGPITAQVTETSTSAILEKARELYKKSPRIIVKIPFLNFAYPAIEQLEKEGIQTMATAIFSAEQALLAAQFKASYVAPYFSRMQKSGIDPFETLLNMKLILDKMHSSTQILVASFQKTSQIVYCAKIGIEHFTLKENIFYDLIDDHPETLKAQEQFLEDFSQASFSR
jgi:transaldolase